MKKRSGTIQVVVNKTDTVREMNVTYKFKGIFSMIRHVWLAYRRKADKIYIFFSK